MTIEQAIRLLAGILVLAGVLLTLAVSQWWLLLPAFVGLNLTQSVFTGFCPAESIFRKLGLRNEKSCCENKTSESAGCCCAK